MFSNLANTLKQNNRFQALLMNIIAIVFVGSGIIFFGWGGDNSDIPIEEFNSQTIDLRFVDLIYYGFRTLFRLIIGIIFSIIFSICYAALAAKSKKAEQILIPLLDVLQSVPILGYMSFTVAGFVALAPNTALGFEMAAIFAIFTSQVWNIIFSVYYSLKKVPQELLEVAKIYNFNAWRRFWCVEMPCAIPDMIWNSIVSMSGAWFFVVAAESITYGGKNIKLPGIGSYISVALEQQNVAALIIAVIVMVAIIFIVDQGIFRILLIWSNKFCVDSNNNDAHYWLYSSLSTSSFMQSILQVARKINKFIINIKLPQYKSPSLFKGFSFLSIHPKNIYIDILWYGILFFFGAWSGIYIVRFLSSYINFNELTYVFSLTFITLARLMILLVIASIVWLPIGIYIGLKPNLRTVIQPAVQFFASFPANLFFPLAVIYISSYGLDADIWLSPLMIIGSQWYILFNVISGASQIPIEFMQVSAVFQIKNWLRYKKIIIPAILPHYLTGLITAAGGGWNASILAEAVSWGKINIYAHGIGGYIAQMTQTNNFPKIALGIMAMSTVVVILNKLVWSRLYNHVIYKYSYI
jgi:NitT/TauT family transport system permease protein